VAADDRGVVAFACEFWPGATAPAERAAESVAAGDGAGCWPPLPAHPVAAIARAANAAIKRTPGWADTGSSLLRAA